MLFIPLPMFAVPNSFDMFPKFTWPLIYNNPGNNTLVNIMATRDTELKDSTTIVEGDLSLRNTQVSPHLGMLDSAIMEISSTQELQAIYDGLTKNVTRIFSARACTLRLWDKAQDKLKINSIHGPKSWETSTRFKGGENLGDYPSIEQVLRNNISHQISINDPGIDPGDKALLEKYKVRSLFLMPFASQNEVFGLIEVYDRRQREFEDKDIVISQLFSKYAAVVLENNQLIEKTNQQINEQNALREAAMTIASSVDLATTLTNIAEQVCKLIDVTSVYVTRFDMKSKSFSVLAEYYSPESTKKERISDLGEVYDDTINLDEVLDLVKSGEPMIYHHDDPDLDEADLAQFNKYGGKTVLEIPLTSNEDFSTILEVWESRTKRVFSSEDIELCKLITSQAVIAIDKARLLAETQKAYDEQKALREAALTISSSLNLNVILTKIAEQVCKLMNATSVYITRLDLGSKSSTALAEYYSPDSTDTERISDMGEVLDHTIHFDEILELVETGEPLIYHHDDEDLDKADLVSLKKYGWKSVMEIPLTSGGDLYTTLEVWESRERREFTDEEIALCKLITSQAAIAVKNAVLYNQAQEELEARKLIQEELKYNALHDPLTDLPNRDLFMDRLEQAVLRKKRYEEMDFGLAYLDLDRFKQVNDTFGHSAGDKILGKAAEILVESTREVDTVARFGGDEFIILLEGPIDAESATTVAKRIFKNLEQPIVIEGREIVLSASMGVALSSQEFSETDDLILYADIAMTQAKIKGKGNLEIFSEDSRKITRSHFEMEAEVRQAIAQKEFKVYYQPIINLITSRLTGFEALLRWQKNDGSMVLPNDFIPVLEETGLLVDVGHWTILETCRQIIAWEESYSQLAPLTISINVSSNQLTHPDFLSVVRGAIRDTGINSSQLIFEITENIFISETSTVSNVLDELQKLGVQVYLDDFGTGYSSLGYLTNFKVDSIKIDRVFINRIDADDDQNGLLHTMLFMAKELSMDVVAEGIEREEQVTVLQKTGCKYGQGFFFNKPQNVNDTNAYLDKHLHQMAGLPE